MAIKIGYSGPKYFSRDGNVFDNPFDAKAADTRYEQQEKIANELKKQNNLLEQQKEEERKNTEIIAEATIQAEKDRYNNEKEIEEMKQEHDKEMRFQQLCDDFWIDYKDIEMFKIWLRLLDKETTKKYQKALDEVEKLVITSEVKKICNEKEGITRKLENTRNEFKKSKIITVTGVKNNGIEVSGIKEKIKVLINENVKVISNLKKGIIGVTIISLIIFLLAINTFGIGVLIIGGITDLILLDRLIKIKNGSELMEKAVEEAESKQANLSKKIKKCEKELFKKNEEIDKLTNFNFKQLEDNKKYKELLLTYNEAMSFSNGAYKPNQEQFYTFRINHYNKEFEILLKKLQVHLKVINKDDIIKEGTKEDYKEFIENAVIELNNVFEDDEITSIKVPDIKTHNIETPENNNIDSLLMKIIDEVVEQGQASTSFIQRRFKIEYTRAGRIIDQMEEMGIISEYRESKPREVLVSKEEWQNMKQQL